jgi:ribonuclease HI
VQGFDEAVEAKAMGLAEAIEFLAHFQHHAIIIEMDNSTIVKSVQSRRYPRNYWAIS